MPYNIKDPMFTDDIIELLNHSVSEGDIIISDSEMAVGDTNNLSYRIVCVKSM